MIWPGIDAKVISCMIIMGVVLSRTPGTLSSLRSWQSHYGVYVHECSMVFITISYVVTTVVTARICKFYGTCLCSEFSPESDKS